MGEGRCGADAARSSATAPAAGGRRRLQVLLGLVWLADGALQLQPSMFTKAFVQGSLLASAGGSPGFVAGPITAVARLVEPQVALWNGAFAAVQLAIGAGLVVRRTVRPALAASFVWSLAVWWLGEGLGGLLTGAASPVSGAPGAVLLYLVVGALAWPRREEPAEEVPPAGAGGRAGRGARGAWAVLWVGSAALLLQPANMHGGALKVVVTSAASGEPGWLSRPLLGVASVLGGTASVVVTLALAATMVVVGLGVAAGWHERPLRWTAVVLAGAIWVLGEALGGVLTGSGTDPGTGPLLVLLVLGLAPARPARPARRRALAPAPPVPRSLRYRGGV